jgi:hypothetical protein
MPTGEKIKGSERDIGEWEILPISLLDAQDFGKRNRAAHNFPSYVPFSFFFELGNHLPNPTGDFPQRGSRAGAGVRAN